MQSVLPLEAQKRMLVEVFLANPNFIQERYITTNYFLKGRVGVTMVAMVNYTSMTER